MKIAKNITELIGNTPLIRINSYSDKYGAEIIAKCEFMNPNSSVKDRIGFSMIDDALKRGVINQDSTIIEPTSGNTGIALASICASLGLKLIIVMPESMSIERRKLMSAFGAKLELTPASGGMKAAIERSEKLHQTIKNSIILQQFQNPANPAIHKKTTALEILRDTNKEIDIFVAAVGTGGTITGVGEILKEEIPHIQIVAVEPKDSPVLSTGVGGAHKIQGIGAGFIPKILEQTLIDQVVTVSNEDAFETSRELAKNEGLLVGISAGANIFAATKLAQKYPNKTILTILPDTGERYLSSDLF